MNSDSIIKLNLQRPAMTKMIVFARDYVFNHRVSPLRHIPDVVTRHMILQILGWMWASAFSLAIGSFAILGVSLLGHAFLIGAAAITVATYTTAETNPQVFAPGWGRRRDGSTNRSLSSAVPFPGPCK